MKHEGMPGADVGTTSSKGQAIEESHGIVKAYAEHEQNLLANIEEAERQLEALESRELSEASKQSIAGILREFIALHRDSLDALKRAQAGAQDSLETAKGFKGALN